MKKLLFAACAALVMTGMLFVSCKKEKVEIEKVSTCLDKIRKEPPEIHWEWRVFLVPEENGRCYAYHKCIANATIYRNECDPNSSFTPGNQIMPLYDEHGNHIWFRCDYLENYITISDDGQDTSLNGDGFELIRAAMEQLYEDGGLLIPINEYISSHIN